MKKTIILVAAALLLVGCGDKNMEAEKATFCETEKVKTSKNIVGNDSAVSFVCINGQKYVKHYHGLSVGMANVLTPMGKPEKCSCGI